jgi:hypothetical protein
MTGDTIQLEQAFAIILVYRHGDLPDRRLTCPGDFISATACQQ